MVKYKYKKIKRGANKNKYKYVIKKITYYVDTVAEVPDRPAKIEEEEEVKPRNKKTYCHINNGKNKGKIKYIDKGKTKYVNSVSEVPLVSRRKRKRKTKPTKSKKLNLKMSDIKLVPSKDLKKKKIKISKIDIVKNIKPKQPKYKKNKKKKLTPPNKKLPNLQQKNKKKKTKNNKSKISKEELKRLNQGFTFIKSNLPPRKLRKKTKEELEFDREIKLHEEFKKNQNKKAFVLSSRYQVKKKHRDMMTPQELVWDDEYIRDELLKTELAKDKNIIYNYKLEK